MDNPVFDKRDSLQRSPGVHVLIAGVSYYRDAAIPKLSSACLSALQVYRWLIKHRQDLALPLATCRLVLSPSLAERKHDSQLRKAGTALSAPRCNSRNFRDAILNWRMDGSLSRDSWMFFYFVGHGFERIKDDGVLILEDSSFHHGQWERVALVQELYDVMAASSGRETMAQEQIYFFDCCREPSWSLVSYLKPALVAPPPQQSAFFATSSGRKAWAEKGQTRFSRALLECLNGDAAVKREYQGEIRSCVTLQSLGAALLEKVPELFPPHKASISPNPPDKIQMPEYKLEDLDTAFCFVNTPR